MTMTTWTVDDLRTTLKHEPRVWVRAAAAAGAQVAADWQIRFMEVTCGASPPTWKEARWEYEQAALFASCESGEVVAEWVDKQQVPFGLRSVEWKVQGTFQVNRHASKAQSGGYERLSWPCIEASLTGSASSQGQIPLLVAEEAPAFFDLGSAAAALFGLEVHLGRMAQSWQSSFRRQDMSGRLCHVKITPTQLVVDIEGRDLVGAIIELASITSSQRTRLTANGPQTVTFDITGSIPAGSLVVMHRGGNWIDLRYLNYPYAIGDQDDVQMEVEPSTRLDGLVSAGEGPTVEFKETLPPSSPDGIRKSLKTVAAFANGDGGTLLYGVTNDGEAVGVPRATASEERLAGLVRAWVSPLPEFSIDVLPVEQDPDTVVYAITVAAGSQTPYGCGTAPTNIVYYFRRGSTTFAVWPHDLRESARSHPRVEGNGYFQIPYLK